MNNTITLHRNDETDDAKELARLSKVDFNASLPEGGAEEMHDYLSLLTADIKKLSKACMVQNVSFGGADAGGGVVTAAVQGEHVEAIQAAHPGIQVRPLTEKEYAQAIDHTQKFGREEPDTGKPVHPTPGRRAA
jgi:hypothetical protein